MQPESSDEEKTPDTGTVTSHSAWHNLGVILAILDRNAESLLAFAQEDSIRAKHSS